MSKRVPALRSLEPSDTVSRAVREKIYAAERRLALMRVAVVGCNTFIVATLVDSQRSVPWLAWTVVAMAWVYSLYVYWVEPYRRFEVLHSSYFTSTSDSILVLIWIYATGGYESPFYLLLYLSVLAIAFRYPPRETVRVAVLYAGGYLGLLWYLGDIPGHEGVVIARVAYMGFAAWLGGGISREVLDAVLKRVGLERQLRSEQALLTSQHQLAEAQEIAHLGSWDWDLVTGRIAGSDELYRILGFTLGQEIFYRDYVAVVHPEDRAAVDHAIRGVLESEGALSVEYRVIHPSGEVRWITSRGRALRSTSGIPERMVGTSQDITARKHLQERLVASDRLVSLGTLAGGVAHEINNPLMYIVGNLEFLEGQLKGSPKLQEALQEARQGADRVRRIVQDLKLFSRTRQDEGGPGDVRRALELSVNMTRNEIRPRASLSVEVGEVPWVAGNESRLGQVFVNLLLNAAHAIPPGSPDRNWVRVRASTRGDARVQVEIEDTGTGMMPDVRSRIFEPFFTTKPVGTGTGLGLAICHGIIQGMGGSIECDTEPGRGTTFRVVLPAAQVDASRDRASPLPIRPAIAPSRAQVRRGRVLVVDDDPLVGAALHRALAQQHEVTLASGGQDALQRIEGGGRFDLILCDLMMPGCTAMDVHAQLSVVAPDQLERLVLMNGGGVPPATQAFLERVANPCLDKPVDARQVEQLLSARLA